jgi:hypothetical protein
MTEILYRIVLLAIKVVGGLSRTTLHNDDHAPPHWDLLSSAPLAVSGDGYIRN